MSAAESVMDRRVTIAALMFALIGCGRVRFEPISAPNDDGGRLDGGNPARDARVGEPTDTDSGAGVPDARVPPALACADTFLGSAVGIAVATGSTSGRGDDSLLCNGDGAPDVTFGWVAPSTGRYRISLCRSAFDTILSVYDGGCTGPMLACDDDACASNFGSAVHIEVVAGQAVVLVVDGLYEEGAFEIDIEERPR